MKIIFLFLVTNVSYSQTKEFEFEAKKIIYHLKVAEKLQKRIPDSSRHHIKEAVQLSLKISNDSLLAAAYTRNAYIEYFQGNDSEALKIINKVDSLANKYKGLESFVIDTKLYRSDISKFTLTMEGVLKAKDYLLEGLEMAKTIKDSSKYYQMRYFLGGWHVFIAQEVAPEKHKDSARTIFLETLKYFKNEANNFWIAKSYDGLAQITDKYKTPSILEYYHKEWLKAIKKTGDSSTLAKTYYQISTADRKDGDPQRGLTYIDSAKVIYEKIGYPNKNQKKNLLRDYGYLHAAAGNYKDAFANMQKALVQSYQIYVDQNTKNSIELEKKYQTQKKEQEIALLKSQQETAEIKRKNQRNLLLGGLGLTSITGIFLFLGFRNRKKTNNKLRELDAMKSSFFENISHEFRTPLSLITGPIEAQLQKPEIEPSEKENLHIAKRNTKRLLTLVDQLLDLSKLEAGHFKLKVEQGNLNTFIKSLTSSFSYLAKENNQDYRVNLEIPDKDFYFDPDALEKIMTNLISNALKYSKDGNFIGINGTIKNQNLHLTVQNSGIVLPEALKTIFDRFVRADEHTAGTGIGLALTKELVTLHKGTITAKSEDNSTIFTVVIPVVEKVFSDDEKAKNEKAATFEFESKESLSISNQDLNTRDDLFTKNTNPILLIVDDNADLRKYVSSLFASQFTVHTAQDGKEGFDIATKVVPDVIVTDLMMPNEDGIAFTSKCKTSESTSHIPIVMLTAKAGDENKLIGLETGADAYLTKPFNNEILKTTVSNLLEARKKLQARFSQEVILIPKDIAVNSADERFLDQLKQIVDTQIIESDFTAEVFAEALAMSRMQLHRKLKALTGYSTSEFIRVQRLKLATQLLKKPDVNVSQIGYTVGFNNHSYFTKCFKEQYGISPSEYIKKHKNNS